MTKWVIAIGVFIFIGLYDMPENPSITEIIWKGAFSGALGAVLVSIGELYEYFKRKKEVKALKEKEMADKYFDSFNNPDHRVTMEQVNGYKEWRKNQENK